MILNRIGSFLMLSLTLGSCAVLHETPEHELSSGQYTIRTDTGRHQVYVEVVGETICTSRLSGGVADTSNTVLYPPHADLSVTKSHFTLSKKGVDIEVITIPLKYRFADAGVPAQLNSNLNGALYLGYRLDRHKVQYTATPLLNSARKTFHFAYSVGVCTGLGITFMSPTNTANAISQEYDGMIWSKGVAAMFGVNSLTVGVCVGFDNLLDGNSRVWIYEGDPFIGLALGLNLN